MSASTSGSSSPTTRSTSLRIAGALELRGIPKGLADRIKKYLRLKNPSYEQACRANPSARYALSEYVKYYVDARPDGPMTIPRGVLGKLSHEDIAYEDDTVSVPVDVTKSSICLRDYQEGVAEHAIKHTDGIFRLSTGFGKTLVMLKIHELLKEKTLVIVPRIDLLDNVVAEYERYFRGKCGRIQGKVSDIKDFTVGTIQSVRNQIESGTLKDDMFGCIIADECHSYIPEKSRSAIEFFRPMHRYGLTGTLDRSDGQGAAISWVFGPALCDRELPGLVPEVRLHEFRGYLPVLRYDEAVTLQAENEERNEMIRDIVRKAIEEGRKVLVLCKRVEHYKSLRPDEDGHIECNSDADRGDRKAMMASLKDGTLGYKAIYGSMGLLSTGVDIPSLDTLVIAGDLKSSVLLRQSSGRILRLFSGKETPRIHDVIDVGNPVFRKQGKLRQQAYASLGWKIIN